MDARLKRVLIVGAQVVVLGIIAALAWKSLAAGLNRSDFLHLRFSVGYLIAAYAGLLGYYLLYAVGAHLVLRALGEPNTTPIRAFKLNYSTNVGKYLPGAIWPAVGRMGLGPRLGLSRRRVAPGMVLEMGMSVAGGLLVFFASLAFGGRLPSGTQWWHWALLAGLVVVGLLPPVWQRVLAFGFKLVKVDAEVPHLSFAATLGLVLYFALCWVVAGIGFQYYVFALVADAPQVSAVYIGTYAAACVGGLVVVFAPGGIGVREGIITVLIAPFVGTGPAAVVGVSARVWSTILELALAGIALLLPTPPSVQADGDSSAEEV